MRRSAMLSISRARGSSFRFRVYALGLTITTINLFENVEVFLVDLLSQLPLGCFPHFGGVAYTEGASERDVFFYDIIFKLNTL
jgi:hypothetical protein